MTRAFLVLAIAVLTSCIGNRNDAKPRVASTLAVTASPIATISAVGIDTLGDSASFQRVYPEPDGSSVAFIFADPSKGITGGLGLIQTSGSLVAQLVWPDSVISLWWSRPHQLSFTAGTGQGVHVVIDAHASQLQALEVAGEQARSTPNAPRPDTASSAALSRAQQFIDSVRVQPEGKPQQSALRYEVDSILIAPGDSFAAVHVLARDVGGTRVNPAWYLAHLPTGHFHALDSLTGRSRGLPAAGGKWGEDGMFYYVRERSIWRAHPSTQ